MRRNMKQNVASKTTLFEYIDHQNNTAYFSGIAERYFLAMEFMHLYNDEVSENTELAKQLTPFLNLKNIQVQKVEEEDGDLIPKYSLAFSCQVENPKDVFKNYAFGEKKLFYKKNFLSKVSNCTNADVVALCKNTDSLNVYTLSVIAFYIYFGYHPFCGREYFASVDSSKEYEQKFFSQKRAFIFDLKEDNFNRFINGYHNKAWELWNTLTDGQRDFWQQAFEGKYETYASFYQAWQNAYEGFICSYVKTGCDEKLCALVYGEKYALITSDNTIGTQSIRCRNCNNALIPTCDNCSLGVEKRVAKFSTLNVKLVVKKTVATAENQAVEQTEESELCLYDGKTVYLNTLGQKGHEYPVFHVIASKKNNLLGLKYLLDDPIVATCGSTERIFKKDGVVPLLSGTQITPVTGCTIIVPGVPVEVVKKPEPVAPPRVKEEKVVEKKEEEKVVQDDSKTVWLEDGSPLDVVGECIERENYLLYPVKGRKTQKNYTLKVFKRPQTEKEQRVQEDIIANIKTILAMKTSMPVSLLYPKGVVQAKGFCEGKVGYIYNELPNSKASNSILPIAGIINGKDAFGSKKTEIGALLDLCNTFKTLHEKGFAYKRMDLTNFYFDVDLGRCYLVDNDYLSKEDVTSSDGELDVFTAQEVFFGVRPDQQTDCFTVAVMMFLILYKNHPFDGQLYKMHYYDKYSRESGRRNVWSSEEIEQLYLGDPILCLDTPACAQMVDVNAKYEWDNTPPEVQKLFRRVFKDAVIKRDTAQEEYDYLRGMRPTMKQWSEVLTKWWQALPATDR